MCGRYNLDDEINIDELNRIILEVQEKNGVDSLDMMPRGEVAPGTTPPVITRDGATLMHWGIPVKGKPRPAINARAETVFERVTFKEAIHMRRIAVPTTGFYEWTHDEKNKPIDKYLFTLPEQQVLYLGGLFNEVDGICHFAIITTEPHGVMRNIHNRQPLFLPKSRIEDWINDNRSVDELLGCEQDAWIATVQPKQDRKPKPKPVVSQIEQMGFFMPESVDIHVVEPRK